MSDGNISHLREVMDRLRSPGGCPWDAEQTHESLIKFLLEESYEFIDAIESGNRIDMREELGDLLLQVYFHSRIAEEDSEDPFNIDDVAKTVAEKLISRHPHVFGDTRVESSQEVLANWEKIKNVEKGRNSFSDGVAMGQPALSLATKLISRAEKNDLPRPEEISPVIEEDLGKTLLALISWAVTNQIDPEAALRKAALQYRSDIQEIESR
jgi:XTP/dITP diphosphohydrolase